DHLSNSQRCRSCDRGVWLVVTAGPRNVCAAARSARATSAQRGRVSRVPGEIERSRPMSKSKFRESQRVPTKLMIEKVKFTDPCWKVKADMMLAAGIVGQILVHFGAGWGSEREKTSPGNTQIFDSPITIATFTSLMMTSVLKNMAALHWDTDQAR